MIFLPIKPIRTSLILLILGAIFFAFRSCMFPPGNEHSALLSPDGKFYITVGAFPRLLAMPGQGSDGEGVAYLYDAAGKRIKSANVDLLLTPSNIEWSKDSVAIGRGDNLQWKLPQIDNANILLLSAAFTGNRALFEDLLSRGANVSFKTSLNQTLLHAAAHSGDQFIAERLIERGLDVNARDDKGDTALLLAARRGSTEIAKLLVENGAEVNATEGSELGRTALTLAAESSRVEIVKLLVAKGADVNLSRSYSSPLWAVLNNRNLPTSTKLELMKLLIAKGADVNEPGLLYSAIYHNNNIAEIALVLNAGTNVNVRDSYDGATPLIQVIQDNGNNISSHDKQVLVELLLSKGADINARTNENLTALALSKKKGDAKIVELLEKHGAKE